MGKGKHVKELEGLREVNGARIVDQMHVDELVRGLRTCAFGAGRLAKAVDIYEEMLKEGTTKFIGIAGALVPAGMRTILAEMIRDRYVDVMVTTGANLVHDIIEALGEHHYTHGEVGEADVALSGTDLRLRKQGLDRIYDVVVHDAAFARLEDFLRGVFGALDRRTYSISELLQVIGEHLSDRDSLLRSAVKSGVPVFCPALADSMIGLHVWLYKQTGSLEIDAFDDMKELIDLFCDAERTGALILGGGVPKNFIFQSAMVAPRAHGREGLDYVIQITMKTPEDGSLSGATLEEAQSWGKIGEHAKMVTVYSDATIALPILMAAVRERMGQCASPR
ncbi:MAG: deoxyhypusine synthase [Methanophagales archaeon ANME-1-THS]|nr:MAG: deoxyhypusine synthase [Methanophagales archaeon ANME-1-THS]